MNTKPQALLARRARRLGLATALVLASSAAPWVVAAAAAAVTVTNGDDSGPGSLRAAIEAANAAVQVSTIVVAPKVQTIALESAVTYTGAQSLTIQGGEVTIQPSGSAGDIDLLRATGGGPLTLRRLTLSGAGGIGLYVEVPADATDSQAVTLDMVRIENSGLNGVYIDDCEGVTPPDPCPPDATGSAGGVVLRLTNTTIQRNGIGTISDLDGIRIDERSAGSVTVDLQGSTFSENDADGIEVDESDAGDVRVTARGSSFIDNGAQPQDEEDPEDGADIDERGEGTVSVELVQVTAAGNFDENLDFNEADDGDLLTRAQHVLIADAFGGRGYDLEETGSGSIVAVVQHAVISGSDDDGMRAQERDAGDLSVDVNHVSFIDNDAAGLELDQRNGGTGTANLKNSDFVGNSVAIENESSPLDSTTISLLNVSGA